MQRQRDVGRKYSRVLKLSSLLGYRTCIPCSVGLLHSIDFKRIRAYRHAQEQHPELIDDDSIVDVDADHLLADEQATPSQQHAADDISPPASHYTTSGHSSEMSINSCSSSSSSGRASSNRGSSECGDEGVAQPAAGPGGHLCSCGCGIEASTPGTSAWFQKHATRPLYDGASVTTMSQVFAVLKHQDEHQVIFAIATGHVLPLKILLIMQGSASLAHALKRSASVQFLR